MTESEKTIKIVHDAMRGILLSLISSPGIDIKKFSDQLLLVGSSKSFDPVAREILLSLGTELAQLAPGE